MAETFYKITFVANPSADTYFSVSQAEIVISAKNIHEAREKAQKLSDQIPGCTIFAISKEDDDTNNSGLHADADNYSDRTNQ